MSREKLILNTPLKVNGEDLTELEYDIRAITINDLAQIEFERGAMLGAKGITVIRMPQNDYLMQTLIGMFAIIKCNPKIDINDLKRIEGYDLTQISTIGMRFFTPPEDPLPKNSEGQPEDIQENSIVQ